MMQSMRHSLRFATTRTLYQVLELTSTATKADVRNNYLKLAKIYHPDVYKGRDKERFPLIQKAYETLSNIQSKAAYDEKIGIVKPSAFQSEGKIPNDGNAEEDKQKDYAREANNLKYEDAMKEAKIEMDLDAEYDKFWSKKSETNFQEIRLKQEHEFLRMTSQERTRRRFRELYNDPVARNKLSYQQTFPDMLDDQIEQMNEHVTQVKEQMAQISKGPRLRDYLITFLILGGILGLGCLAISLRTRYKLDMENKQTLKEMKEKLEFETQMQTIVNRLIF